MFLSSEDTVTRAIVRIRKVAEHGGKETKEAIEQLNSAIIQKMGADMPMLFSTINELLLCESLHATEKFILLDILYDTLIDILERKDTVDLGEIPRSLMKMKFMKNEKYVERAVIMYLNVIMLILDLVDSAEHRISIFKVFCTLFMSRSFINSSRCGYLIPHMFKRFLSMHPEFIENLIDNEDKLVACGPLLETVIAVYPKMNTHLSRLVFLDFIKRKSNITVLSSAGKGLLDPFYYRLYIEREPATAEEIIMLISRRYFLEYLVLDVSIRLTSKDALEKTIEKILLSTPIYLVRMMKEIGKDEGCTYCSISDRIEEHHEQKNKLQILLEDFNSTGNISELVSGMNAMGFTEPEIAASRFLRASASTNLLFLGKSLGEEKNKAFLTSFCSTFNFSGHNILSALRIFLLSFNLPGEGQKIERIVYAFCKRYAEDKKQHFETILSIAMSIVILNTSIHNMNMVKKIQPDEFVSIVHADCPNVEEIYLSNIYEEIKREKLQVPQSNEPSVDNIDFLSEQSEADRLLHTDTVSRMPGSYCNKCSRNVYIYILDRYSIRERIIENKCSAEIKEFVKTCMEIGAPTMAYQTIECIDEPSLILYFAHEYRERIYYIWKPFIYSLAQLQGLKEDMQTGSRFFRHIFSFGKESKKEKKEIFADSVLEDIAASTKSLSEQQMKEAAEIMKAEIEKAKPKLLCSYAYLVILKNIDRISIFVSLIELSFSSVIFSTEELMQICNKASFNQLIGVLMQINYSPSRHSSQQVLYLLQNIEKRLEHNPDITPQEMIQIEKWLLYLISSEMFKTKQQEYLVSIWEKIGALSLYIDKSGHDSMELLIKIKSFLKQKSKAEIIKNTKMYYKNLNRMLMCIDLLQSAKSTDLEVLFLETIEEVASKDIEGIAEALEKCESVLVKMSIHKPIEEMLIAKAKNAPEIKQRYLVKLLESMSITEEKKAEVIDL